MNRIVVVFAIVAFFFSSVPTNLFGQDSEGRTTPFSFIKEADVGREIGVTESQLSRVDMLQPICDAACRAQVEQALEAMPAYLQTIYSDMPFTQRMNAKANLEQDIQETTELTALDGQVLLPNQMARFNQLYTQQSGIDGLLSGVTSRNLGVTEAQKSSISQIQSIGFNAMDACRSNPNLSPAQQNAQIQQIQNSIVDQSVNVLNIGQINLYINLCGPKLNSGGDALGDDVSDDSAGDDGDAVDGDVAIDSDPSVEGSDGPADDVPASSDSGADTGDSSTASSATSETQNQGSSRVRSFGSRSQRASGPSPFGSGRSGGQSGVRSFRSGGITSQSGSASSSRKASSQASVGQKAEKN